MKYRLLHRLLIHQRINILLYDISHTLSFIFFLLFVIICNSVSVFDFKKHYKLPLLSTEIKKRIHCVQRRIPGSRHCVIIFDFGGATVHGKLNHNFHRNNDAMCGVQIWILTVGRFSFETETLL